MSEKQFSIGAQLEEVDREIRLREKVYPNEVKRGAMRESVANYHLDRMRAVRRTLAWLAENETKVKEALAS